MPTASDLPIDAPDPLADLRRRFVERARLRLAELDAALTGPGTARTVAAVAHQLAGSAGTFGYGALSRAAAALEDAVRVGWPADARIEPALLGRQVAALRAAVAALAAA